MNITIYGNLTGGGKYNGTVKVNLTAYDNVSNVSSLSYSLNGGAWKQYTGNITISDGQNTLLYGCEDFAGNVNNSSTVVITVFNPDIDVNLAGTRLSNWWFTTDVQVTFIPYNKPGDGFDHIEYSFDNGKNWETGYIFDITKEGWNHTYYRAVDDIGNVGDIHELWVAIDKTKPTISCSINGDKSGSGWYNGDVTIRLDAHDDGSINLTQYSFDKSNWHNYDGQFTVKWGSSRTIYYRTFDMANRSEGGETFIYFRPGGYDQGTMSDSIWINGVLYGPSSGTSDESETPENPTMTPTDVPWPTPTQAPSPTPETETDTGTGSPLALAVLIGVAAIIIVAAAAAYFFMLKPK